MLTTLDRILETTRSGLPALRARRGEVEAKAAQTPAPRALAPHLKGECLGLIAEVKRRSPSQGEISSSLDPAEHAAAYERAGATAISVLTDGPYFGGSLADLQAVARRVSLPVLRKDFILDEVQIAEARAAGASAILLIVRALTPRRLVELARASSEWGLEALVEVHSEGELAMALDSDAPLIGVNSRNLDTFVIDIQAAWELIGRVPPDRIAVAESGMANEADVRRAADAGADAVLIGTALSAAPDPAGLASELAAVPRIGR
jgi:indole-3-glycerol phosphate synthase